MESSPSGCLSPERSPTAAPRIHRLEESVINRIAAGEVIQRPVSAVKELVENSLDAGSTSINVVVKDGGLKLIQVSDNGHGIRFEDLPILCERHTTSKLSAFEDLQTIKSMGFRGEALASMTYVAHVTVTTITEGELHGYRVSYRDGVMEHEPRPCAAVKGTQVMHGVNKADVHTVGSNSTMAAIRAVYGLSISRDLVDVMASENDPSQSVFDMKGFISNANYNAKKTTMVLFINERLVECTPLKRAIEVVYAATVPKAAKPFVYMSIVLPPEHIDVNVHPTKRETLLPGASSLLNAHKSTEQNSSPGTQSQKVPVNKMVRVDSLDPAGRMHAYLQDKSIGKCDSKTDLASVSKELMYQQVIRRFAHFNAIQLSNPAPLPQLMLMELEDQELASACQESDGENDKIVEMNTELLKQKSEMLMEYFCLEIDQAGNLSKLPVIIDQYTPDMDRLPQFVWRLTMKHGCVCAPDLSVSTRLDRVQVDWDDERNCFQSVAAVLADFYAMHPPLLPNPSGEGLQFYKKNSERSGQDDCPSSEDVINEELVGVAETAWSQREWTIQHVLFPSMRLFLKPNNQMATDGTFVQIATLEKLYRVFERC
ncbi:DNA mismatch repair protein [Nymphaea thermarum]|nr:DNA mismatch repair protein [Nymphaea thermarum]